jgi:hypothetical protein
MKFNPTPLEIALLIVVGLAIHLWARYGKRISRWFKEWRKRRRGPRQLKPRKPGDCPLCRAHICWLHPRPSRHVVPWSEVKNQTGRPKTVDTTGYACFDPDCAYFLITDPMIHALVSDGWCGKDGDILYLRCQACGGRKTSRLHTPYHIKTALARVEMMMTSLSEGVDISAAMRIFGHHHTTISRWLERGGIHSACLHERLFFRVVVVGHIQLDELVTKVKLEAERVWVWTAIAARSKLILAVHIGGRAIVDACQLIHRVQQRLAPDCLPVFTSDGLNQYFYGLPAHFGYWDRPPRARKYPGFPMSGCSMRSCARSAADAGSNSCTVSSAWARARSSEPSCKRWS